VRGIRTLKGTLTLPSPWKGEATYLRAVCSTYCIMPTDNRPPLSLKPLIDFVLGTSFVYCWSVYHHQQL
jgi:hypothetical protein